MNTAANSQVKAEVSAVIQRNGRTVDLGVITSPYDDRLRNWLWKKWKTHRIRRLLNG